MLLDDAGSYFSVFEGIQNQDCGSWSRLRTGVLDTLMLFMLSMYAACICRTTERFFAKFAGFY